MLLANLIATGIVLLVLFCVVSQCRNLLLDAARLLKGQHALADQVAAQTETLDTHNTTVLRAIGEGLTRLHRAVGNDPAGPSITIDPKDALAAEPAVAVGLKLRHQLAQPWPPDVNWRQVDLGDFGKVMQFRPGVDCNFVEDEFKAKPSKN